MKLVIVESPTKAKTISKFLGKNFRVESSYGHVRDLPKSKLGIDVKKGFEPTYVILPKAKERVATLKQVAEKASTVILATDEDREGEAIAWHLLQALGLQSSKFGVRGSKRKEQSNNSNVEHRTVERIAFHEITESAVKDALEHPREIDMRLVDAQQARRVLDRLVGYELSPFLWRKIRYGLSAGRVQSVAVRLIAEREREIEKFIREEYWTIEGLFSKKKDGQTFPARLQSMDGKALEKMGIENGPDADAIVEKLRGAEYRVKEVGAKTVKRFPAPPFTTSTLQQEASRKLGFSAKQTMMLAQNLYENGFITYMRTDSVNLANQALMQAKQVIAGRFGPEYALDEPRRFATKSKGAQEAHEAIRPTDLSRESEQISVREKKEERLYELILKRTLASQMKEAVMEQTAADIETLDGKFVFRANGQTILFDGFLKVYTEGRDEENGKETEGMLPKLEKGEAIEAKKVFPLQHFTEPPARYTDATLVKTLEAAGVGRPSTYAPTLSTIQDRGYVEKIDKRYAPTETGFIVNDLLVEHFPEIVDINFTSHIEEELDEIAEGKIEWATVTKEFYGPFKTHLTGKEAEVEKYSEASTTPCPHCGKMMVIKFGRFGKFLACPDPETKVTLPMPEEAAKIETLKEKTKDEQCPLCGKPMEIKRGRFGFFLGCADYPKCKGIAKIWEKTGFKCPNCNVGDVVLKKSRGRGRAFYACNRYPDCTFIMNKKPETEQELQAAYEAWKNKPASAKASAGKPAKEVADEKVETVSKKPRKINKKT